MEKNILALGTLLLFLSSQAFGWGPDTCKKAKCEVDGGKGFCNFDLGKSGFCEPCADIQNCEWLGLPPKGAKACKKLVKERLQQQGLLQLQNLLQLQSLPQLQLQ